MPVSEESSAKQTSTKGSFKPLLKLLLWFNVVGVVVLTATNMLLGEAVIGSFVDEGTPQAAGRIGWFLASLGSAICTMLTIDGMLIILAGGAVTIYIAYLTVFKKKAAPSGEAAGNMGRVEQTGSASSSSDTASDSSEADR